MNLTQVLTTDVENPNRGSGRRMAYRPDIDGLRGIAVLSVVAFHATSGLLPGGFSGVDIFFVISGFLISRVIVEQLQSGQFSFAEFYARRIRRLFPALILVLVASWIFGWLAMVQAEYKGLEKHIAGGSLFSLNFMLWTEDGYFDVPSAFKPLLHLWSLSIEEQFYLAWPAIVYFSWRRRVNVLSIALAVLVGSFVYNLEYAGVGRSGLAGFYLPQYRFWELAAGAVLACIDLRHARTAAKARVRPSSQSLVRRALPDVMAWTGFALVLAAEIWLNARTIYPGWRAIIPTTGAFLLIAAGMSAWLNRHVLSRKGLVYIGLISCPLYLWHWPMLSFVRLTESGAPSSTTIGLAVALAFVLASLTYHLIERPLRQAKLQELKSRYPDAAGDVPILRVHSPNAPESQRFIEAAHPDISLALCKNLLAERVFSIPTSGTFVLHPGICPEYRNAHGCFWALAQGDVEHVGMTMLRIDRGIDTGPIFGYFRAPYDERTESHIVIQHRMTLDNLDAIATKFEAIVAGHASALPTTGRASYVWGQPWLTAYLRWRRGARERGAKGADHRA